MTLGAYLTQKEAGTGRDYLRKVTRPGKSPFYQKVQPD